MIGVDLAPGATEPASRQLGIANREMGKAAVEAVASALIGCEVRGVSFLVLQGFQGFWVVSAFVLVDRPAHRACATRGENERQESGAQHRRHGGPSVAAGEGCVFFRRRLGYEVDAMSDDVATELARNLRRMREARGLSQQRLADVSGVPRPTLAHLESGTANPTLGVLLKVAEALRVELAEMVASERSPRLHRASAFSEGVRGKARIRQMLPPDAPGVSLQRVELAPGGRFVGRKAPGHACFLLCDQGQVRVTVARRQFELRQGEALDFEGSEAATCANPTRRKAVCYSVTARAAGKA